ncbi:hypothetical protein HZA99_05990 [Candidatus Woesearchaeota archaeon]|nr:hypothetical protein [Candidatus Woesearchaeota archaeon]
MGFKTLSGTAAVVSGIIATGTLLYVGGKLNIDDAIGSASSSVYSTAADYTSGIGSALSGNTSRAGGSEDAGATVNIYKPASNTQVKAADPYPDLGPFVAAQPPAVQRDIIMIVYDHAAPAVQHDVLAAMYKQASPAVKEGISVHLFADLPYDNKVTGLEQMAKEMEKTIYQQQHMALK